MTGVVPDDHRIVSERLVQPAETGQDPCPVVLQHRTMQLVLVWAEPLIKDVDALVDQPERLGRLAEVYLSKGQPIPVERALEGPVVLFSMSDAVAIAEFTHAFACFSSRSAGPSA